MNARSNRNPARVWLLGVLLSAGCVNQPSHQIPVGQISKHEQVVPGPAVPMVQPEFTAAIKEGDVAKVVELLKGNYEQINLPLGESGWTPLHRAVLYSHQKLVRVLIEQGADVNLVDNYGWAPLHYAAMNGNSDALSFLLAYGADKNRKAQQGESPLHWAVNNNQNETVSLLVRAGAYLNTLDDLGRTPLDIATTMGLSSLAKYLRDAGCLSSRDLARTYDWTATGKTLLKLKLFHDELTATYPQQRESAGPNATVGQRP